MGERAGKLRWKGTWVAPDLVSGRIRFDGRRCHSQKKLWRAARPAAVPTGLVPVGAVSEIDLTWSAAARATSYRVLRAARSGGPYQLVSSPSGTSFADTGLAAATHFFYAVRAVNDAGRSARSAEAGATTLPLAPAAPSGIAASALSSSSIRVSWDAVAGADGYEVLRSPSGGGPYSVVGTPTGTSFDDSGLGAATTFFYVVRATNTSGESPDSAEVSATTTTDAPAG